MHFASKVVSLACIGSSVGGKTFSNEIGMGNFAIEIRIEIGTVMRIGTSMCKRIETYIRTRRQSRMGTTCGGKDGTLPVKKVLNGFGKVEVSAQINTKHLGLCN